MNLTSLAFILLFSALGGVIAYFADRLGRTLGKKRLSLFGLRPRHTAEVLTVGAGALIPLVTLLLILSVSSEVRKWVAEGPRVLDQRDKLLKDVSNLDKERQDKTQQLENVNQRYDASQRKLMALETKLSSVQKEFEAVNLQLKKLTSQYQALRGNYQRVASQYKATKAQLAELDKTLAALNKTYDGLRVAYTTLNQQQKEQFDENARLLAENAKIVKEVEQGKADSASQKADFERQERLNKAIQDQYKSDIEAARHELQQTLNQLDTARVEAQRAAARLDINVGNSRFRPLIYNRGEEVARETVDPGLDKIQARAALDSLLRQAQIAAGARGAHAQGTSIPAAFIAPRDLPDGRTISTDEQEDVIAEQLANSKESLVLVAYSEINAFDSEAVALDIHKFPNPIVYKNGQTIAEGRINGRLAEAEVVDQVKEFLEKNVSDRAKLDNMILVASSREPAIQVSLPEILDLVRAIKFENRTVKLFASADGDTRAAGPLKLQFHLQ